MLPIADKIMIPIKQKIKLFTQVSFIVACLFSSSLLAEVEVSQSVSSDEIAFEDSVQFQIVVEWKGGQADYLFNKPLSPYIDRMKIGRFSSSVSSLQKDGIEFTQKKYNYTLLPTSAGLGLIDSISIAYLKRGDTLPSYVMTEPMEITIAVPQPKVKKDDSMKSTYIFGCIILLVIGIFVILLRRKNSQTKEVVISPKEEFLTMLTNVKNASDSDFKKFQTDIFSIISNFLLKEYKVDVVQVKLDGLIDELSKAGMSMKNAEQITEWLKQAEIDKYAPASTSPGAVVRLESEIRTFFEKI